MAVIVKWFWSLFNNYLANVFQWIWITSNVILGDVEVMLKWFWGDFEACVASIKHMCFVVLYWFWSDFNFVLGDSEVILMPV